MANRWGNKGNSKIFLSSTITADGGYSHEIKRCLLLDKKAMTNLDGILQSRDVTLMAKVCLVKAMVFPVVKYGCELDHKEGWTRKNWCFLSVLLEKTLESLLDSKQIKQSPKGSQTWIFIGRTNTSLLPNLHSNPLWWKGFLFCFGLVLVLEGVVILHRIITFSFCSISGWGIDLDYYNVE